MNRTAVKHEENASLSTILVIGMVVLGLIGGWVLMSSITNRTTTINQSGLSAQVPAGWNVNPGLIGEEMIFWTADQLDPNRRYVVSMLPAVPGGSLTDVVVTRNLNRSQSIAGYVVIDQAQTKIQSEGGYRVDFAFTTAGGSGVMPKVIKGMDYYLLRGDKVLVITFEDEADTFDLSTSSFLRFLESVRYPAGG